MLLRLYLLLGLLLHKGVWEYLKWRDQAPGNRPQPPQEGRAAPVSPISRLVKLLKLVLLLSLIGQTLFLDLLPITAEPFLLQLAGGLMYTIGLATAVTGRIQLGENWANLEDFRSIEQQSLVTHGIYRFIRHPIYAGDLLLLGGLELALNSWLVLGVIGLFIFTVFQARAEELALMKAFPDYQQYRRRTKMFIPFVL